MRSHSDCYTQMFGLRQNTHHQYSIRFSTAVVYMCGNVQRGVRARPSAVCFPPIKFKCRKQFVQKWPVRSNKTCYTYLIKYYKAIVFVLFFSIFTFSFTLWMSQWAISPAYSFIHILLTVSALLCPPLSSVLCSLSLSLSEVWLFSQLVFSSLPLFFAFSLSLSLCVTATSVNIFHAPLLREVEEMWRQEVSPPLPVTFKHSPFSWASSVTHISLVLPYTIQNKITQVLFRETFCILNFIFEILHVKNVQRIPLWR